MLVTMNLTIFELRMILDDCRAFLESNHIGSLDECGEMRDCPVNHFDEHEDGVTLRQEMIEKIEAMIGE
jgi:hypothetical protein